MADPQLRRSITLPFLIFYGVGTMVGGGFYALLGKVAGEAGTAAPLAFALTGLVALLSGFSFAELAARFPVASGPAHYVQQAFRSQTAAAVVGWLVISTGVVSAATLAVATVGFLRDRVDIDPAVGLFILVSLMALIASWGIGQSVGVVTAITVVEVGGLLYVFFVHAPVLTELPSRGSELLPGGTGLAWIGLFAGSFLAFYALIGFEDLVTLAEEVRDVRRTLPTAILVSIVATTLLYVAVATVAVLDTSVEALATSATPVAELVRGRGWMAGTGIWLVSLLTGINGALVQIVMAARMAYGMAQRGQAPSWLGHVHARSQTPLRATAVMGMLILTLALFFPLTTLAKSTSAILLVVFATVNLALWRLKGRSPDLEGAGPRYPRWLSLVAAAACMAVLAFQGWLALLPK